jgi:prepilin-type N-terminal cleavage/methylation domain-containing protein
MLTRDDSGFSLVELLLVIVILGVITVPLANVIIASLQHTDQSAGRLAESHDAQLSSAYWAADVASIGTRSTTDPRDPQLKPSVETGMAYADGAYPCGTAGTPPAVVRFAWDDVVDSTTTTVVVVAYIAKPVDGRFELHRLQCAGSTTPVTDVVLAHDLLAPPVVECDGGACAGVPRSVLLRLTIKDSKSREPSYEVTLTGHRRQE